PRPLYQIYAHAHVTIFPYTTLFRSKAAARAEPNRTDIWSWLATAQELSGEIQAEVVTLKRALELEPQNVDLLYLLGHAYERLGKDRKSTRLNSSHGSISYAVFCLKK